MLEKSSRSSVKQTQGKLQGERPEHYEYEELIDCSKGILFGKGNPQLPGPPLLMFDRISKIHEAGGGYGKGQAEARDATVALRDDGAV